MKNEVTVYLVIYFSELHNAELVIFTDPDYKPAIFASETEALEFKTKMLYRFPSAKYEILSKDITL